MAQVPDIPQTLFLGPDSRMPPEMGEGPLSQRRSQLILSQTTSCASCALPPAACAPFCTPFRSMLLPLTPTYPMGTCSPPPSCPCMCAHTCGGCRESRQWRVREGGLHVILPPSLELSSPVTGLLSVCTTGPGAERQRERFLGHQAIICPGKQGPPETEPDRLFLLHFLSQDSFPWGISPSFSSPQLLLAPP